MFVGIPDYLPLVYSKFDKISKYVLSRVVTIMVEMLIKAWKEDDFIYLSTDDNEHMMFVVVDSRQRMVDRVEKIKILKSKRKALKQLRSLNKNKQYYGGRKKSANK